MGITDSRFEYLKRMIGRDRRVMKIINGNNENNYAKGKRSSLNLFFLKIKVPEKFCKDQSFFFF